MSEPISVLLSREQSQALSDYVYKLVADSVESVKRDAGISQRWLRKGKAATYAGVSEGTFSSWVKQGLPCRFINGVSLFSKSDIDFWIMHNGSMK